MTSETQTTTLSQSVPATIKVAIVEDLRDIREGKFGDYFCRAENSIAVPSSGVNEWRRRFLVPAKPNSSKKERPVKAIAALKKDRLDRS